MKIEQEIKMAISSMNELYSKRLKEKERAENPEPLEYEILTPVFRRQILYLLDDLAQKLGKNVLGGINLFYTHIDSIVCYLQEEYGKDYLYDNYPSDFHVSKKDDSFLELKEFIRYENYSKTEQCLDAIESIFRSQIIVHGEERKEICSQLYDEAIDKLNQRFQEHNLGYRFTGNSIVRLDSEVSFQNIHKPVLNLLQEADFTKVNRDYADVLQLHRKGNYKIVVAECRNIYESLLKHIIGRMGGKPKNRTRELVYQLVELDLIPKVSTKFFIDCIVIHHAAHGEGETSTIQYDQYMAELIMNNTGSAILFLVKKYLSKNTK